MMRTMELLLPTSLTSLRPDWRKMNVLFSRRVLLDVAAVATLIALPLVVFWMLWAPLPADRMIYKGDILMQGYPSRYLVHSLLNMGELPLWNPYQLGGMPLLGDVQVAVYYLPNLLLDLIYLGRDLPYQALEGLMVAHYALAGVLFYGYLRNLGLRRSAALLGAIAFQFNGFFIGHRGHVNMFAVAVWIPGVLWMLDRAWASQTSSNRTLIYTVLAGIALSQMAMAGHPQLTMYGAVFIFAYFLFRWIESWQGHHASSISSWRDLWHGLPLKVPVVFMISGVLAGGIAAVALLPAAELLGRSMRSEPSYAFSAEYSFLPRNLINLLLPEFMSWSGTEFRVYPGILTLILAVVAWIVPSRRRPEQTFYTMVLVVGLFVALGGFTAIQGIVYRFVPGLGGVRVTARIFFFVNFSLAVLAAMGLEALARSLAKEERLRLKRMVRTGAWAVVAAGAIAAVLYMILAWNSQMPGESFYTRGMFAAAVPEDKFLFLSSLSNDLLLFVLFLFFSVVLLAGRASGRLQTRWLVLFASIMLFVDLATFAPQHDALAADPENLHFVQKELGVEILTESWRIQEQQQIIDLIKTIEPTIRVDNGAELLPDNFSQVWGVPFTTGYNILDLRDRVMLRTQWPYLPDSLKWDLFAVGYVFTDADTTDAPEPGAELVLSNSHGSIWKRAIQPQYAQFTTQIRPVESWKSVNALLSSFPDAHSSRPAVAEMTEPVQQVLTEKWPGLLEPVAYQIGKTGVASPANISVYAGGVGQSGLVIVDGITVTPEQRGIVYAALDPITGEVLHTDGFDTHLMESESDRLAAVIDAAADGTIVMLATYDEGISSLNERGRRAIATLGAREPLQDASGMAYALVGVKGSPQGTALEQISKGPVVIDVGVGAAGEMEPSGASPTLIEHRPTHITVLSNNATAGLLTISETAYPGWSAYVNGERTPVFKANGVLQSVVVPPAPIGDVNEVTFAYQPLSFRLGATVSILTLFLALGLVIVSLIWRPSRGFFIRF